VNGRFRGRFAGSAIALLLIAGACSSAAPTPSPSEAPTSFGSPSPASLVPATGAGATPSASEGAPASAGVSPAASGLPPRSAPPTARPPAAAIPDFRHVYVIVMENHEYSSIVGATTAHYIRGLIARYGLATSFYAETHPSEPNYIAMTSGSLQGVTTDGTYNLSVPNVFDQVETSGRTWHVYAQDYPGGCFTGSLSVGGVDGPGSAGEYVRKHNPAISYRSISRDAAKCGRITNLASFDPAAANFEYIVPNLINDMHSSSIAAGDAFLAAFVPKIVSSAAFVGSVLFITWDEGSSSIDGGGHIPTIVVSPGITPGYRAAAHYDHYSMLRTIEEAWGMPLLGGAATAAPMALPY
jgi:phosphatidylinositol-3-phosphatase